MTKGETASIEHQWVFMFPGQGSQFVGMGKDFHAQSSHCREIFERMNQIVDKDMTKLCFRGPISKLSKTDNLQIALTATNLSIADFLIRNTNIRPSVVLGHSVGEYSALCLAGSLSTDSALELAYSRGSLMQREAKRHKGLMYAIKDVLPQDLSKILDELVADEAVVIANDNSHDQQVISGEHAAVNKVLEYCAEHAIEAIKLPVSGAWHSNQMLGCVDDFQRSLMSVEMQTPNVCYVNNMTAGLCHDVDEIREHLVAHITGRVRWRESIQGLINQGYCKFIEVGPKKVLTRLLESIAGDLAGLTVEHVQSVQDIERLAD